MSLDIRPILAGWEFDPDRVQVRMIAGEDGSEKIQMRIDLGLMQMEIAGRPDGQRPRAMSRCWNPTKPRRATAEAAGDRFTLGPDQCAS